MEKSVLIVDDHEVVRRSLRVLFEGNRFNVFEASNGAEAIQQAQQVHPDLVVLDMIMPVMNGLDALRGVKAPDAGNAIAAVYQPDWARYGRRSPFRRHFGSGVEVRLRRLIAR